MGADESRTKKGIGNKLNLSDREWATRKWSSRPVTNRVCHSRLTKYSRDHFDISKLSLPWLAHTI